MTKRKKKKKKLKLKKKIKKIKFKKSKKKKTSKIFKIKIRSTKKPKDIILKLIRFQENFRSKIKFKINIDILTLDRSIQRFFQKIETKIQIYKNFRIEEKKRIKIDEINKIEQDKLKKQKQKIEEEELKLRLKQKELKDEERLERERSKDIKLFLRKEQAILRKEQAERQKRFLEELKLEKQIDKFRVREIKELEKLEKISLTEKREDYAGLQNRIEKLKEKYRLIRDQKIRERVEALGVNITQSDDRETLLEKEREYNIARQNIELALESFYRSASSLVFQLNKRHITRHMSIFRCIDRRFETGEIFIKWDEAPDDEWLILIYIKDNSPNKGIIIEDKSNPEKNISHEFKPKDIFKASDTMVDSLTQLLAKERSKKTN